MIGPFFLTKERAMLIIHVNLFPEWIYGKCRLHLVRLFSIVSCARILCFTLWVPNSIVMHPICNPTQLNQRPQNDAAHPRSNSSGQEAQEV